MKGKDKTKFVLSEIINNIPYYVFWKDRESVFMGCNERFAESVGVSSPHELIGKTDYDFSRSKEEAEQYRKIDKEVMDSKEPVLNVEEESVQLDGSTKVFLTNKVPLCDPDGNVNGVLGIYADITDRKKLEVEKDRAYKELKKLQEHLVNDEKLKCLGEMAGGISHEINNPLSIIKGYIQVLRKGRKEGALTDEIVDSTFSAMEESINRCVHIIASLRTFSKDTKEEFPSNVKVNELVDSVLSLCKEKIKKKGINISFEECGFTVYCQKTAIEQAIMPIISNAVDALKEIEKPSIKITAEVEGDFVCIIVSDNGDGVSGDPDKIFLPFYSTKDMTGLGLSTAKSLIERNEGGIEYYRCNKKTCFKVKLKKL